MNKLVTLTEYREKRFMKGSRPVLRTLQKLINDNEIVGKKLGGRYYVEVDDNFAEISPLEQELFTHG